MVLNLRFMITPYDVVAAVETKNLPKSGRPDPPSFITMPDRWGSVGNVGHTEL
jgi:hypothetical protein